MEKRGSQEIAENLIEAYNRFIPTKILQLMGKDSITQVNLGDNVEKTMTILFSDIRDFTSLSEQMTPQENFNFLNSYLKLMEPIIARYGGIIDKYIGDGIMALFPGEADDALHCAIEMLKQISDYNELSEYSGRLPLKIGIGINTGVMMLGIIGGEHRLQNTVISDAVNLASHVESMTKNYGTPLLISEQTYYSLQDESHHDIRFIDRVKVKGKSQPQSIYEVFDADHPTLRTGKRRTKNLFEEALAHYHFREASFAMELFANCLDKVPEDKAAQVYFARCEHFLKNGFHESSGEFDITIEWDPFLTVGHPEIDAQHQALFRQVKIFLENIRTARNYAQLNTRVRQ